MAKYYFLLLMIVGIVLYNIYVQDPCNNLLRTDFSNKYPDYKILDSSSGEGSPDDVQCHIYYKKPDSQDVYKDTWLYINTSEGWNFSRVIATGKIDSATGKIELLP